MGELGNLDELGDLQNIEGIEETLAKQMKILKDMHKMQQEKSKDGQHKRNKTHGGPERASKVLFDRSPNESPLGHLGKDQMDIQEELNLNAEEVLNEEMMNLPSKSPQNDFNKVQNINLKDLANDQLMDDEEYEQDIDDYEDDLENFDHQDPGHY